MPLLDARRVEVQAVHGVAEQSVGCQSKRPKPTKAPTPEVRPDEGWLDALDNMSCDDSAMSSDDLSEALGEILAEQLGGLREFREDSDGAGSEPAGLSRKTELQPKREMAPRPPKQARARPKRRPCCRSQRKLPTLVFVLTGRRAAVLHLQHPALRHRQAGRARAVKALSRRTKMLPHRRPQQSRISQRLKERGLPVDPSAMCRLRCPAASCGST